MKERALIGCSRSHRYLVPLEQGKILVLIICYREYNSRSSTENQLRKEFYVGRLE